jgi:peptide/nickel transport system permease protein
MTEKTPENLPSYTPEVPAQAIQHRRPGWARRLLRNPNVVFGSLIFLVLVLMAVFAGVLSTHKPTRLFPAVRLKPPSLQNYLGTD